MRDPGAKLSDKNEGQRTNKESRIETLCLHSDARVKALLQHLAHLSKLESHRIYIRVERVLASKKKDLLGNKAR